MRRGVHLLSRCVKLVLLGVALTAGPALAHPGGRRVSLLPDQLCQVGRGRRCPALS